MGMADSLKFEEWKDESILCITWEHVKIQWWVFLQETSQVWLRMRRGGAERETTAVLVHHMHEQLPGELNVSK